MKKFTLHPRGRSIFVLIAVLALSLTLWSGCEIIQGPQQLVEPEQELLLSPDNPIVKAVMEVQNRHTEALLAKKGVVGTATTMTETGQPAIVIYTETARLAKAAALPETIEDVPVIVKVVGELKALKGPPGGGGGGVDPTARFDRPVPIGVSTGHPDITAGTISCRVTDGSDVYALSNNHVYADVNAADIGDAVIQPGTYDGGSSTDDDIGTLFYYVPISFSGDNVIDAAIALSSTSLLGNATPSNGYGTPRTATVSPSVNLRVMKYGRTTGQTKGRIDAINATVNVNYGAPNGVATFVNQIIIIPGSFGAGGDSGSLVVVEKGSDARKPVGLYYAGSSQIGVACPIDAVLNEFGVTVDGDDQ